MESSPSNLPLTKNDENELRKLVQGWVSEARTVLMQLGLHIKNMIREAQTLVIAASKSRDYLESFTQTSKQLREVTFRIENALFSERQNVDELKSLVAMLKECVEKTSENADRALQSCDEVFRATHDIDEHITNTTQTLMKEVQMMQDLKGNVLKKTEPQ